MAQEPAATHPSGSPSTEKPDGVAAILGYVLSWLFRKSDGTLRLTTVGAAALTITLPLSFWLASRQLEAAQAARVAQADADRAWHGAVDLRLTTLEGAAQAQALTNVQVASRLDSLATGQRESQFYLRTLLLNRGIDPEPIRQQALLSQVTPPPARPTVHPTPTPTP